MKPHWAAPLVGKPWSPNGQGPDDFSCWGLVRWVFREQEGIAMPELQVGVSEADNVAALAEAAHGSGWRPVFGEAAERDIVVMRDHRGRHVGVMVGTAHGLRLLHSDGWQDEDGKCHGSVIAQPLIDALRRGFRGVELWRKTV